jgi:transposase
MVVLRAVCEGRLLQADAAERLGLSVRLVKRLARGWRAEGAKALVSKRRGRPSTRRIDDATRDHFVSLVRRAMPTSGRRWPPSIWHSITTSVTAVRVCDHG